MQNLRRGGDRGRGSLKIQQTDMTAFWLGPNIALTPGKVVFQNDLIQLLQYEPTTEKVHKRPLLIFPPWINKYYILDLTPEKSFVKWAVGQGFTVFVVRSEEHTSELQSLMRISYAVFCLKQKTKTHRSNTTQK